jgi:hypothetical protein
MANNMNATALKAEITRTFLNDDFIGAHYTV